MSSLNDNDFEIKNTCPWCGHEEATYEYTGSYDCKVVRCKSCNIVYATKVLNIDGLAKYWKNYESEIHCVSEESNAKRAKMYQLEYDFIAKNLKPKSKILDIGCADGSFLDYFAKGGYECYGVEYGEEAAQKASKKYKVYVGDFHKLDIDQKFDLVIFRGTIQYLLEPKEYFKKAASLLNEDGLIYITSSPDAESYCFKLFKEKFTQPVAPTDRYAFNEKILNDYFFSLGLGLVDSYHFYLETPYRSDSDIDRVKAATKEYLETGSVSTRSPSFFGNMLTLVYRKFS